MLFEAVLSGYCGAYVAYHNLWLFAVLVLLHYIQCSLLPSTVCTATSLIRQH